MTTAALAFLLVVLAIATFGRLWTAVVVAIGAAMALNFFFIPPVGTFAIAGPHNWGSLFAFLVVAVIASHLSATAQARARDAIAQRNEVARLLAERDAAELERQKAELAATLLASLSHDLRTPLTAIRVALENLHEPMTPEDRSDQARLAISEVDRLTDFFQDILDMARIDAGATPLDPQWVSPADVVDAANVHVRHTLGGRRVLVDADSDTAVDVDPRLASVALSHLLENAAKYSPADRDITVVARGTGEGLQMSVTDGGPGVDPSEFDHLFERFYRGGKAKDATPGTGMGLAIARGLVAAAGGRVWAENMPGGGARFSIVVPGTVRKVPLAEQP